MAVWGEASYKVKRAITFHERFTVVELVDATDLAYAQVEQVVQRLIKQGYVRKLKPNELNEAERAVAGKVGRPRQRYTLTDDKAKREEFYASVEAIASAERLSRAKERKPSTPYFDVAIQVIEAMESGREPFSSARLKEAAALLAYGRDYEELIPEGAEIAQAHYDIAQARLEALQGNHAEAERLLIKVRGEFNSAGLAEEVRRVEDFLLSIKIGQQLAGIWSMVERCINPLPAVEALNSCMRESAYPHSLLLPLRQAVELIGKVLETKKEFWAAIKEMHMVISANEIAMEQNKETLQELVHAVSRLTGERGITVGTEGLSAALSIFRSGEPIPVDTYATRATEQKRERGKS